MAGEILLNTGTMLLLCGALFIASQCCGVHAQQEDKSDLLLIRSSVNGQIVDGTLAVPKMECGYLFCKAPGVHVNTTIHYWDYYIDWEMPQQIEGDPGVFLLGNQYQMPRSYLVFKGFNSNFTGRYQCRLHFRNIPITFRSLHLTLHPSITSRSCPNSPP